MSAVNWDALLALFEGAQGRPKEERAAFLDEHTKGDAALRREIESLLAAHEGAGGFLSTPALGPRPEPPEDASPSDQPATGSTRLASGTALGVFTILEPLGAGGMGEVYRARDVRLDRLVAIKVLSSERDTAPGARERFEREARAISRLSHPRICTVHDVGVANISGSDVQYLVMELLDGETLAAKIARGPLSIEQSLAYAIDIADALIAAHAQGIVHRDLKPANVMVTATGIKLLDFGLAQLRGAVPAGAPAPAVSSVSGLTSEGLVFGTLPYISPEQLRAERVDARTDIFAFGALLYEMLTGGRPFAADSQAGLIAAILEHEAPPVSDRLPLAPASLDRIVQRCLAKNPDDRWQTARDLKSELIWVRDGREEGRSARTATTRSVRVRPWRQIFVTSIPTAAALVLAVMVWRAENKTAPAPPAPSRTVTRLALNLPPGVVLDIPINGSAFAIAPDGSRIAFIGARQGRRSLFVHTLESGKTVEVPDTHDISNPMFSPDSQWVAFSELKAVVKLPATGEGSRQLMLEGAIRQWRWLPDGRIVNAGGTRPLLLRQQGAPARELTRLGEGEESHNTPVMTADGSILFTVLRGGYLSALNSIAVLPSEGAGIRQVVPNATSPQLAGPGALVFAQGASLIASAFDSHALQLTGEPRALGIQAQTTLYSGAPMYALANNGTLVYAEPAPGRRLIWVDRRGGEELLNTEAKMYSHLRLSPDGTRVATNIADADRDLWVLGLDGKLVQRLTSGPARDAMPVWSHDSSEIFFTSGERNIYRIPADRSRLPELVHRLLKAPDRFHPLSLTPDGKRLLTHWDIQPDGIDLRIVELGPKPTVHKLIGDSLSEADGQLSPDRKWLAYQSGESVGGRVGQIVVRPFPDVRARQFVISTGSGTQPIWSRDGREIFYRTEDGTVMSVRVRTTPSFSYDPAVPVVTPRLTLYYPGTGPTYDVSLDGRRFLLIRAPELDIRSLTVILNWDVEVKAAISGAGTRTP
jgi:serine/threonine protein kinase/Tol biopolymer transport system component